MSSTMKLSSEDRYETNWLSLVFLVTFSPKGLKNEVFTWFYLFTLYVALYLRRFLTLLNIMIFFTTLYSVEYCNTWWNQNFIHQTLGGGGGCAHKIQLRYSDACWNRGSKKVKKEEKIIKSLCFIYSLELLYLFVYQVILKYNKMEYAHCCTLVYFKCS